MRGVLAIQSAGADSRTRAAAPRPAQESCTVSRTVAALYVETGGVYFGLSDVDPWDVTRDARRYAGPYPVVAHPPCARWSRLAGLVQSRWGHEKGDDEGCFAAALAAVRAWGGVLEHPAFSSAWSAFRLPVPARAGGWQRGICGGWTTHVEQGRYGHAARKPTWLYAFNTTLLDLRWGRADLATVTATCSWARIGDWPTNGRDRAAWQSRRRLNQREASASPPEFRDALLALARSAA